MDTLAHFKILCLGQGIFQYHPFSQDPEFGSVKFMCRNYIRWPGVKEALAVA